MNLSDNLFNATIADSTYPWGQDVIIALLLVIAFCQILQTFYVLYRRTSRHD
ncbi:hypothetical protein V7O62_02270 [Methanolobus sp. ZRKC2]|uniref:hypothetical protein n=1 Tax=Methanolobus sp. ZRKC2 TaxID=3125783 RepID=UPI00324B2CEF